MFCSPKALKAGAASGPTCYTRAALVRLAQAYNAAQQSGSGGRVPTSGTKETLWRALHEKMRGVCGENEACWLDQPWAAELKALGEEFFRPPQPEEWSSKPYAWLSNYDIADVMKQYEKEYKDFRFLGVFPVDFAEKTGWGGRCVVDEMCTVNPVELRRAGVRHVGAVFNLDRHDQPGSHWVGFYSGLVPGEVNYGAYYYDSNGLRPPAPVLRWMRAWKAVMTANASNASNATKGPGDFPLHYSRRRHQYGNSECGLFSMFFVIRCLAGVPFRVIMESDIRDQDVHKLRTLLFRPASPKHGGSGRDRQRKRAHRKKKV